MTNKIQQIVLIIIFSLSLCSMALSENIYTIERKSNKITLKFRDNWSFSEIKIPVCSLKLWGNNQSHNIIILEIGKEKHILSRKAGSDYLEYSESSKEANALTITSIETSTDSVTEQVPFFKATLSQTKYIEDNLSLIIQNENNDILRNKCFSCHSLIPTALMIKTAQSNGYKINKSLVNNLFIEITRLQNSDGSFYFEKQPCYGKNSTTLSAGYILALLSDFMPTTFITTGEKINEYLQTIITDNNSEIKPDFIFEPFFNNETTALLHEIIFQKNMYLKESTKNQSCNERVESLQKGTINHKNDSFQKKLLLFTGIPYSYQIPPNERQEIVEELERHFQLPKTKVSEELRMICLYVYRKLAPASKLPSIYYSSEKELNNIQNIWNCFEKILYNSPKYLNGNYNENEN